MQTFNYGFNQGYGSSTRPIKVVIPEIKNLISNFNTESTGWKLYNGAVIGRDRTNKIVPDSVGSIKLRQGDTEDINIKKSIKGLDPDKKYLFTVYIRNNAVGSSQLFINDELADYSTISYVKRLSHVVTPDQNGEVEIGVRLLDLRKPITPMELNQAWLDGFFLTEISQEHYDTDPHDLLEIYPYVKEEKSYVSALDILKVARRDSSPYLSYLIVNGRKITDYHKDVSEYGLVDGGEFEVGASEEQVAIMNAIHDDIATMAMLGQDKTKVSHAFPKEDEVVSKLGNSYFPRVQYFTGFSDNQLSYDNKARAVNLIYAVNVYIPTLSVDESVSAIKITEQIKAILADLGWATIRGSDYYLKKEQLYVLQTQFEKTTKIVKY